MQCVFHQKKGFYILNCIFSNKYPRDHKRVMFMLRSNATRSLSYGPKQPLRNQRRDAHLGWCAWAPGHQRSSLLHIWPLFHTDQQSSHACQMVDHAYKTKDKKDLMMISDIILYEAHMANFGSTRRSLLFRIHSVWCFKWNRNYIFEV